jgi:hypothetical protein
LTRRLFLNCLVVGEDTAELNDSHTAETEVH